MVAAQRKTINIFHPLLLFKHNPVAIIIETLYKDTHFGYGNPPQDLCKYFHFKLSRIIKTYNFKIEDISIKPPTKVRSEAEFDLIKKKIND